MTPRIKICGITREEDAATAAALAVDAVGFVLWPASPRAVTAARARALARLLPPWTSRVGVFVAPTPSDVQAAVTEGGLTAVQLHGVADPRPFVALGPPVVWVTSLAAAAPHPSAPPGTTLMLDAHDPERHGGTGRTIDWALASMVATHTRLILSGGLTADNVAGAVAKVRPYAVDTSSGVEVAPGVKSAERMQQFVNTVRAVGKDVVA